MLSDFYKKEQNFIDTYMIDKNKRPKIEWGEPGTSTQ